MNFTQKDFKVGATIGQVTASNRAAYKRRATSCCNKNTLMLAFNLNK